MSKNLKYRKGFLHALETDLCAMRLKKDKWKKRAQSAQKEKDEFQSKRNRLRRELERAWKAATDNRKKLSEAQAKISNLEVELQQRDRRIEKLES